jgi:hypothetical protein
MSALVTGSVTLRWALWLDLSSDLNVVGEGNEWLNL